MYTILGVIEDSTNQQTLSAILRPSGYGYLSADSAIEAIAITRFCAIDLVVLDQELANRDCGALVGTLKAVREIPIISIARKECIVWNRERSDLLITSPVYAPELLRAVELFCSRKTPVVCCHVA